METIDFVFSIAILICSVVVHEVAHGLAAYLQGDKTAEYAGRLTLNPIRHLDPIGSFVVPVISYMLGGFIIGWAKPVPFNPYNLKNKRWGEAIVALAGPLSNLALALLFGLLIRVSPGLPESFIAIASVIVYLNITLALFNLMPVPPLDGSKILFALLPTYSKVRSTLESGGLILVLVVIFVVWPLLSPLIGITFRLITGLL